MPNTSPSEPSLYPVYLNLAGRRCLVAGAGEVAWRKIQGLARAGAAVVVVAPEACPEVLGAADRGELVFVQDVFRPALLDGCALCVAATNDEEVNRQVSAEARRRGLWVNVVDRPDLCDFEVPAVLRRGLLQVAVSSGGASPLLAGRVRREIEERLGPEYGTITAALGRVREELRRRCPEPDLRRRLEASVDAALRPAVLEAARAGRTEEAEAAIKRAAGLESPLGGDPAPGGRPEPSGGSRRWRVGCRGSGLARRQAELVIEALRALPDGPPAGHLRLVTVTTSGDVDQTTPLATLGTVGTFTSELERALLEDRIDFAVHSLKDLPTEIPAGLALAAVTRRADPREALVSRDGRTLGELPPGAVVGTSSPRRAALVRRRRPDLVCRPLRGNVDTRLRRLDEGAYDAVVLAAAGLERLGLGHRVTEFLDPEEFVPAPAQGFLAVECREDDAGARGLVARVEDPAARLAAEAERAFLRRLGAGCHAAAGALARVDPGTGSLEIHGLVLAQDGRRAVEGRRATAGPADPATAARVGAELADELLAGGAGELVREGEASIPAVRASAQAAAAPASGTVYLVGAGPGDPGLLTVRGAELLRRADCVVVDRLANPSLLELVPPESEVVLAGKEPGRHTLSQAEISHLLVEKARQGLRVVRLKGGDPFVFGRGGEEAQDLRAAGVRFEVVPGVTSAVAGPAYAGIPVTHRGLAQSVAFVTGHGEHGAADTPDFGRLARGVDTLVVLMGAGRLAEIVDDIRRAGRPDGTPACVVASATTAEQRVVSGTLGDIARRAEAAGVSNPALLVVGAAAGLRQALAWHEHRPLAGRRIVVTRSREQASALANRLADLGADVLRFPAVRVRHPAPGSVELARLDDTLRRLGEFDWVALSSVNGVEIFFERLAALGLDARALAGRRVAAIGPATAERLASHGVRADLVPDEFRGEALAAALAAAAATTPAPAGRAAGRPGRVLFVRSDLGRPETIEELERRGLAVEEVAGYLLQPEADSPARAALREQLVSLLAAGRVDALTFASSATVRFFLQAVGRDWLGRTPAPPAVFCIGPVTAQTARQLGLPVTGEASPYTIDGLVSAVVGFYRERKERTCST